MSSIVPDNSLAQTDEQRQLTALRAEIELLRGENNRLRQQLSAPVLPNQVMAASAQLLKAVFDSNFYALVVMDTDLRIRALNEKAIYIQHYIYNRPINLGDYAGDIVSKENKAVIVAAMQQVLAGETLADERDVVGVYDGKHYWFDIVMAPVYDDDRRIIGVCYGAMDITARKLAEMRVEETLMQEQMLSEELTTQNEELNQNLEELEATQDFLRRSEERLKKIYNGTPALMLSLDRYGVVQGASQYWLDFMGYQREEILGMEIYQLVLPEYRKRLAAVWRRAFKQPVVNLPDCQAIKRNGELIEVSVSVAADTELDGQWIGLVVVTDLTARNQAARALQDSEQNLAAIFNSQMIDMVVLDRQYRLVRYNSLAKQGLLQRIGADMEVGMSLRGLLPANEEKLFFRAIDLAFAGQTLRVERQVGQARDPAWFDFVYTPVLNAAGHANYVIVGGHNVTERKKAELEVRQTKEQLQNIFDSLDNVFWSIDLTNNKLILLSPAFEKVYERKIAEVAAEEGLFLLTLAHPDDAPRLTFAVQQCRENGTAQVVDFRVNTPAGRTKWLQTSLKPYFNRDHNTLYLEGITTDITFRKESEMALVESELNFRSIYEQAAAGIFQLDLAKGFINVNRVFAQMLGHSRHDLQKASLLKLTHPEHHEELYAALAQVMGGQTDTHKLEARLLHQNGQLVWLLITLSLVRAADQSPKYVLGIVQNISELKKVQQDLIFKNNELDTFVYRASHDLRGPITSLQGLANIMAMEENSPTMEHYIQVAQQSTKRLDTILQNLIELTKIKSAEMVMAPVDIWELIKDILAGFSNLPEFGRVKTITEVRLTRPFYSDDRLLRAVLQNLIENAIKYSRHNIADAYAQVLVEEVEDGMVKITVEDNGEGIPKAHLDKVFNMFFRATESSKGSGLGLYILRNALDKLQGTVHVDSDLGKGTRFTVFLPQQPTQ